VRDLVVCGYRVDLDLSALYIRSGLYKIKTTQRLFEIFLKTKPIDLSVVSGFLFPEDPVFYPKTANEVMRKIGLLKEEKEPGKIVWNWYDHQEFDKIESRTTQEVDEAIQVYLTLQKNIQNCQKT
jgi:hypothetical protein